MIDYNSLLSEKINHIKPSGIRRFFDIVEEMKDCVSLGIGEPDFVTPWHIREAGIRSLEDGHTYYTSNSGLTELREEISSYMKRRFHLSYNPKKEIVVTVGGSEAIDLCIRSLVNRGDEVLIPEPSFVCYSPITELTGGIPVPLETKAENEFRLTAEVLKSKITPKTKLLILPFPNNPTGAIMEKKDLEEIAAVLRDTNVLVLSDELYAELTYTEKHFSIAQLEGMAERTIVINGFSKAYAMTGWRLGYACGPATIIAAMTKIHQFAIMSAPTTSQYSAIEAIKYGDEDVKMMREQYNQRRRFIVEGLRKIGLDCFEPLGAFYVFPSIKKFGLSSEEFCERLLREQKCAVIPGNAFGESGEGFVRISYAYSTEKIAEALKRIEIFINKL
jgi:aminotransferase